MVSYPLSPHLSSELWLNFNKFPVLNKEIQGNNNKQNVDLCELQLPNLSFLKNFYINQDLIRTKIFV